MLRPRIIDDRGRSVRLHPFGDWASYATVRERLMLLWRAIRALVGSPLGAICITAIVGVIVVVSLTISSGWWVLFIFIFSPIGGTAVLVFILIGTGILRLSRGRASQLRDEVLQRGRCPACLYELRGVETDSDDCKVCPECGAAWKSSDIQEGRPAIKRTVIVSEPASESPGR